MAALGENLLPPLLVVGLLSRVGALGLPGDDSRHTILCVPEELLNPNGNWAMHLSWAAPLLVVLARGPGAISVDKLLGGGRNR